MFLLGHLCKTLFGHLLRRLFNYAGSLIQALQIPILDSEPIFFYYVFQRLLINGLSLWIQILCVKFFEVRYHLELKAKEDCVLERQKGKRQHS